MSQAKVDQYKVRKANRKEIMKKEKQHKIMLKISAGVIGIAMLGWIGFSVYHSIESGVVREQVSVDYTAIESYMNTLGQE